MAATKYLDYDGLLYFWTLIKGKLALKADKSTTTSAGSYGPSANATPAHGGNFKVPYVTVNAQGIVTGISEKTVTLPSDNNTDTLVKQNLKGTSDTGKYPILMKGSTTATDSITNEANYIAAITVQPSTGTIKATKFEGAVVGKADDASHADEADVASQVANNLVIKVKTGTTEGTDLYTYNGSAGKTLDIKQGSNITLTAASGQLTITGVGDTKNTAGSTDSSSKLFLIGATSQAANPQTYSQDTAYVGTDGHVYSNGKKVFTADDAYTKAEVDSKISSAVNYRGSVATYSNLPANPEVGDMYNVTETDENYIWAGAVGTQGQTGYIAAHWDPVGAIVNLVSITNSEIDTVVAS